MPSAKLTTIRFEDGIWEAYLSCEAEPQVEVQYLDTVIQEVEQVKVSDGWIIRLSIPLTVLSEGVHCLAVFDLASGMKLGSITVIAGEPAADDLRSEVELLRAELDMLKRAFRKHCAGTD